MASFAPVHWVRGDSSSEFHLFGSTYSLCLAVYSKRIEAAQHCMFGWGSEFDTFGKFRHYLHVHVRGQPGNDEDQ